MKPLPGGLRNNPMTVRPEQSINEQRGRIGYPMHEGIPHARAGYSLPILAEWRAKSFDQF
jgi:hypothetical protein